MNTRRLLIAASAALALASCAIGKPIPQATTFGIAPPPPTLDLARRAGTLRMGKVRVAPAFAGKPLVLRLDEVRYETDFYNAFLAEPADLLGAAMADWLDRAGPFLWYALLLVVVSIFYRKFFCKYLCPLGAALAIPAPLRIFDWLRRRKECGRPCQICAIQCEVQAIRPTGEINPNECHYCLDCQVTYWDDHQCPPLSEKRIRREKSRAALERDRKRAEARKPHDIRQDDSGP